MKKFCIFIIIAFALTSCGFKSPEVIKFNNIKVENIQLSAITANLNATIRNPNKHEITINAANIDVIVKDIKIGNLTIDKCCNLPANNNAECWFKTTIATTDALKAGVLSASEIISGKFEIKLVGTLDGEYWFIKRPININTTIKP